MRDGFDHDYPPAEWSVDDVATALRSAEPASPLPTYEDEGIWSALREDGTTGPVVEALLDRAAEHREEPVPPLPATLYLDLTRTGNRTRYQDAWRRRQRRLGLFVLAECFEREGRYLDPILDHAWAICEQATWVWPSHLRDERVEGLPGVVPDEERTVALFSAGMAKVLAEVDHLLGERLHPALRERIRAEADEQVFTPYEAREDFSWMGSPANNWNAVCNAGAAVAAAYLLEDVDRQARILTKAVHSVEGYLADFDDDGCTAEGIGYWNYGFGNYVELADHLETRTGGACSLFEVPIVREIATYPQKVELSPGRYVPFSDAHEETTVAPYLACRLGERLSLPGMAARGRAAFAASDPIHNRVGTTLRNLLAVRAAPGGETPTPSPVEHLEGFGWWIARAEPADPDGLVVAAKAGHNQESHNHNDCGTFVVHCGRESLLTDLGSPTYDRDYFGPDRYTAYLAPRSLGHSVPYVNGCEQASGRYADDDGWYASEVIERSGDGDRETFGVELAGAYPDAAGLEGLRRTITLDRSRERVTVADEAAFEGPENALESVVVSYVPLEERAGSVLALGERGRATVTPDTDAGVEVEHLPEAVDERDVWRARFAREGDEEIELALSVDVETTS